jgi:hypothetical protein
MPGTTQTAEPVSFEIASDLPGRQDLPLSEADEIALAAELLELTSEEELDQFLGSIFRKAGAGLQSLGKPLSAVLKDVARVGVPILGAAAGTLVGGPVGGAIGGSLASAAGKAFGLETEGMSPEDRDFEIARRYVRLAAASARHASRMRGPNPAQLAKRAVLRAARTYAPGILRRKRIPPRRRYPRPGRTYVYAPSPAVSVDATAAEPIEPPALDNAPDGSDAGAEPAPDSASDAMPDDTSDALEPQPTSDDSQGESKLYGSRRRGRWFRRGRHIVLVNL